MTSQQIQNRALRREQVERYLATDMTVKEWCGLNQDNESTMYRRMAVFRREEPGMFVDPTHGEWIELSRGSIAARTALCECQALFQGVNLFYRRQGKTPYLTSG